MTRAEHFPVINGEEMTLEVDVRVSPPLTAELLASLDVRHVEDVEVTDSGIVTLHLDDGTTGRALGARFMEDVPEALRPAVMAALEDSIREVRLAPNAENTIDAIRVLYNDRLRYLDAGLFDEPIERIEIIELINIMVVNEIDMAAFIQVMREQMDEFLASATCGGIATWPCGRGFSHRDSDGTLTVIYNTGSGMCTIIVSPDGSPRHDCDANDIVWWTEVGVPFSEALTALGEAVFVSDELSPLLASHLQGDSDLDSIVAAVNSMLDAHAETLRGGWIEEMTVLAQ